MYAFINDISIAPEGVELIDSRPLIQELIRVFFEIRNFKIEKLSVPLDFFRTTIGGSHSIFDYYQMSEDPDERNAIVSFLDSTIEDIHADYFAMIQQAESRNLFDIYLDNRSSFLLKEAYLLDLPVISLGSKSIFKEDTIICEYYTLTDAGILSETISLRNFYSPTSLVTYGEYLLQKCYDIHFATTNWRPFENPCWRSEITKQILEKYGYPAYRRKLNPAECRARNMEVAITVLLANGWYYNITTTRYNHHRQEIWRVYSNDLCRESVYISVDLVEGEFEVQDRRGRWKKTLFFNGEETGKDYTRENSHNINLG